MHLGTSEEQPRVMFESSNEDGSSISRPHGYWKFEEKMNTQLADVQIPSVAKDVAILEVRFHYKGDEKKMCTMYCASLTGWPGVYVTVAWSQEPEGKLHVYDAYQFGKDPSKQIFVFKM